MSINYENQVRLLVRCIPVISEYDCFALKGGTAINLFYRNLPRLSVDIDLVYINNKPRKESFEEINSSLNEISSKLESMESSMKFKTRMVFRKSLPRIITQL